MACSRSNRPKTCNQDTWSSGDHKTAKGKIIQLREEQRISDSQPLWAKEEIRENATPERGARTRDPYPGTRQAAGVAVRAMDEQSGTRGPRQVTFSEQPTEQQKAQGIPAAPP
jgi:hypothetical protein